MSDAALPRPAPLAQAFSTFAQVSRLHIIAIACLACLTFGWLFSGHELLLPVVLCAVDWFIVNLVNRVVDLAEDRANGIVGTELVEKQGRLMEIGCIALLVGSLAAVHPFAPQLFWARVAFHAIGLAYNYKLLPLPKGRTRFKETYFFKNFSSAVLFILSTQVYPWLLSGAHVAPGYFLCFVGFFLPLEMTYEIIYDLRDVKGDAALNVPTFPVVHGERASHLIIWSFLALSAASIVAGGVLGYFRLKELALIGGTIQQALYFHFRIAKEATAARCIFLTWLGAAQIASYHLWIMAGLPTEFGGF